MPENVYYSHSCYLGGTGLRTTVKVLVHRPMLIDLDTTTQTQTSYNNKLRKCPFSKYPHTE